MCKIKLENVRVFDERSQETICFYAELWVDGRHIANLRNSGCGEAHHIEVMDGLVGRQLAERARRYCTALPNRPLNMGGYIEMIPMDLELFIDIELNKTIRKGLVNA